MDDEPTSNEVPTIVRSTVIDLVDDSLSLEMGGRSQLTGDFAYTFLAFVEIVPVD